MKYFNISTLAAATLLATSGLSFASSDVATIDNKGDLRITLASGVDREVTISGGGDTDLNVSINGLVTTVDNYPGFTGDIYVRAIKDDNADTLVFENLSIAGSVNVLSGRGDDSIRFIDSVVGGIDVRVRQGDDHIEVSNTTANGKVVLRGFSGEDTIDIAGSIFQENLRVRAGRDDDDMTVKSNMFMGEITRFNGRNGIDQITHGGNLPSELDEGNFRNIELFGLEAPPCGPDLIPPSDINNFLTDEPGFCRSESISPPGIVSEFGGESNIILIQRPPNQSSQRVDSLAFFIFAPTDAEQCALALGCVNF